MKMSAKVRDQRLDIAKGIAIILVVIGHTIQARYSNFDDVLGFRVIYSFHMPLFIFLSGAVASLWFDPNEIALSLRELSKLIGSRIKSAFIRLVIPFISWALIAGAVSQDAFNPLQIVIAAFRRPDNALWFLLCIFYCVVLLSLFQFLLRAIYCILKGSNTFSILLDGRVQLALIGLAWLWMRLYSPPGAGLATLKMYFLYYILGIGFYKYLSPLFRSGWRVIPYLLFIPFVAWWSRTAQNNLLSLPTPLDDLGGNAPFLGLIQYLYAPMIAIAGIFLTWDIVCRISQKEWGWFKAVLAYLGKLSLGIYAIHTFFLDIDPAAVMPLFISVAITPVLMQVKFSRLLLLGER